MCARAELTWLEVEGLGPPPSPSALHRKGDRALLHRSAASSSPPARWQQDKGTITGVKSKLH